MTNILEEPTLNELMDRGKTKAKWLIENAIPNGECLECHLSIDKDGYSQVSIGGKNYRAHRLVYKAFICDPGDLLVIHSCDNRRCIKPKHLSHGTQKNNIKDMINKGRRADTTGMHRALTAEMIADIFVQRRLGVTQRELAIKYRVDQSTISRVISGERGYADVKRN